MDDSVAHNRTQLFSELTTTKTVKEKCQQSTREVTLSSLQLVFRNACCSPVFSADLSCSFDAGHTCYTACPAPKVHVYRSVCCTVLLLLHSMPGTKSSLLPPKNDTMPICHSPLSHLLLAPGWWHDVWREWVKLWGVQKTKNFARKFRRPRPPPPISMLLGLFSPSCYWTYSLRLLRNFIHTSFGVDSVQ